MFRKTILSGIIAVSMLLLAGCTNTSFMTTTTKEYEPVTVISPEVGMEIGFMDPVALGGAKPKTVMDIDDHNAKVRNYNEIIAKGGYDPLEMTEVRIKILNEREELMKRI